MNSKMTLTKNFDKKNLTNEIINDKNKITLIYF